MAFIKKEWTDRVAEFINRRRLTFEDGSSQLVTVSREEGDISEEGDAFSAENMNELEERIEKEFSEINSKIDDFDLSQYEMGTANRVLVSDSNGKLSVSSITTTLLGFLSGLTGNIQTQLNNKSQVMTSVYLTESWSIGANELSKVVEFNVAKSGYTAIGIIGFDISDVGVVSVRGCDLSTDSVARVEITHVNETIYQHSGTASIRVLYVKN